jgi:hypothetical protein
MPFLELFSHGTFNRSSLTAGKIIADVRSIHYRNMYLEGIEI